MSPTPKIVRRLNAKSSRIFREALTGFCVVTLLALHPLIVANMRTLDQN